jgi:hypothetical protein
VSQHSRTLRLLDVELALTGDLAPVEGLAGFGTASPLPACCLLELHLPPGTTTGELLADITRLTVEQSRLLCIHAGLVTAAHGAVAIPGPSGLGKTTLVAAMVQRGFGYLSDEVLALRRDGAGDQRVPAFARPLGISADSWGLLELDPARAPGIGEEALAAPATLGAVGEPAPVVEILLTSRRPGPIRIEPATRARAVPELLRRSFNHYRDSATSLQTVLGIVRNSRVWQVEYADAGALAAALAERWL